MWVYILRSWHLVYLWHWFSLWVGEMVLGELFLRARNHWTQGARRGSDKHTIHTYTHIHTHTDESSNSLYMYIYMCRKWLRAGNTKRLRSTYDTHIYTHVYTQTDEMMSPLFIYICIYIYICTCMHMYIYYTCVDHQIYGDQKNLCLYAHTDGCICTHTRVMGSVLSLTIYVHI